MLVDKQPTDTPHEDPQQSLIKPAYPCTCALTAISL